MLEKKSLLSSLTETAINCQNVVICVENGVNQTQRQIENLIGRDDGMHGLANKQLRLEITIFCVQTTRNTDSDDFLIDYNKIIKLPNLL